MLCHDISLEEVPQLAYTTRHHCLFLTLYLHKKTKILAGFHVIQNPIRSKASFPVRRKEVEMELNA
jgi:hypothetical protein